MEINLDVYITDYKTIIKFDDNKSIIEIIDTDNFEISQSAIYFLLNDNKIIYIGKTIDNSLLREQSFNKIIKIMLSSEVNIEYLEYAFIKEAIQKEITLVNKQTSIEPKLSEKQKCNSNDYKDKILFILKKIGYDLFNSANNAKQAKKTNMLKARHKWSKEISQIIFTAKSKDGEGKVIWKSKDELVLLSGAKLVLNPQTNKDGSINYSAQFAEKLRSDYSDKIDDNFTTEDIIFKSPNQLGMFLFFGGQNTWAELKDSNGKTLDDWSRVD